MIVITIISSSTNKDNINSNSQEIIVKVKDFGKGLDFELFSKVFSKFFSYKTGGTGLGLYICKAIIEAHGGKIWAENNKDDQGTTFSFSLPLKN
ncbi:putative Histidine kinase [Candidatus Nitrosocosmicus arcticus]|uniref:Putative Histidine kinase n=1 Tax=Candidatus Nitrosocosmicus arcticus TaxID=2035267 RepID=A0A557SU83_9ARCH|nr:putative Histidine kinase [Candidatus Nitrosocosmicus arcticus]